MSSRRVSYRWMLRDVMADHGLFATTALAPLLAARGIDLSMSQIHRLVTGEPERLSLPILAALCDIFECTPNDLLQINVISSGSARAAGDHGPVVDLDSAVRPTRARIRPDP